MAKFKTDSSRAALAAASEPLPDVKSSATGYETPAPSVGAVLAACKLAHPIDEISKLAPVGRTRVFQAIREGHLVARKFGRRTMVLDEDLRAWLKALPRANHA